MLRLLFGTSRELESHSAAFALKEALVFSRSFESTQVLSFVPSFSCVFCEMAVQTSQESSITNSSTKADAEPSVRCKSSAKEKRVESTLQSVKPWLLRKENDLPSAKELFQKLFIDDGGDGAPNPELRNLLFVTASAHIEDKFGKKAFSQDFSAICTECSDLALSMTRADSQTAIRKADPPPSSVDSLHTAPCIMADFELSASGSVQGGLDTPSKEEPAVRLSNTAPRQGSPSSRRNRWTLPWCTSTSSDSDVPPGKGKAKQRRERTGCSVVKSLFAPLSWNKSRTNSTSENRKGEADKRRFAMLRLTSCFKS